MFWGYRRRIQYDTKYEEPWGIRPGFNERIEKKRKQESFCKTK